MGRRLTADLIAICIGDSHHYQPGRMLCLMIIGIIGFQHPRRIFVRKP